MSIKSLSIVAAAVLAFCAGAAQAVTTNGFANGGFELAPTVGDPPGGPIFFADSWLAAPTGNFAMRSSDARTGSYSALVSAPNGFGGSTLFQNSVDHGRLAELTAANVGDTPVLSFWAKGDVSTTGNVLFSLRYLAGNGGILGNSGNVFFQNQINTREWTKIEFQGAAIPANTKAVFLEMNTAVGPLLDNRLNAVLIDDIYLGLASAAPIPEPETYALMLLGLAGVCAVARRRRAAA